MKTRASGAQRCSDGRTHAAAAASSDLVCSARRGRPSMGPQTSMEAELENRAAARMFKASSGGGGGGRRVMRTHKVCQRLRFWMKEEKEAVAARDGLEAKSSLEGAARTHRLHRTDQRAEHQRRLPGSCRAPRQDDIPAQTRSPRHAGAPLLHNQICTAGAEQETPRGAVVVRHHRRRRRAAEPARARGGRGQTLFNSWDGAVTSLHDQSLHWLART